KYSFSNDTSKCTYKYDHGDFHPTNVLVREDGSMVAIDLSNVNIMDIRFELGFTYAVLSHPNFSGYNDWCIKLYENEAGMKIENLDFFIIISNLHNALRMYSCAFDYTITNENEGSSEFFYGYVKGYTQTVFESIKQSTGVELLPIKQRLQLQSSLESSK
ncbi:MAG: hypothetical protein ACC656_10305, partial [Candidatus Heimdallarchaeota archaeon]